jgi:hypothetical protein
MIEIVKVEKLARVVVLVSVLKLSSWLCHMSMSLVQRRFVCKQELTIVRPVEARECCMTRKPTAPANQHNTHITQPNEQSALSTHDTE